MKSFRDDQGIRYTLVSDKGGADVNWVFIPGGPGADSRYLLTLTDILDLPGKVWRIDLPGNGDNPAPKDYDYHEWLTLLPAAISKFDNCIIVGHSFGGMLPLLLPELEEKVIGLVIINSAPRWSNQESEKIIKKLGIPKIPENEEFKKNRTQENQNKRFKAMMPYWFTKDSVSKGMAMFEGLPFPVKTMLTLSTIMQEIDYDAKWIPQSVPTLIIIGDRDYLTPSPLFEQDKRFHRANIKIELLKDCGHWCWIEKPNEVKALVTEFYKTQIADKVKK